MSKIRLRINNLCRNNFVIKTAHITTIKKPINVKLLKNIEKTMRVLYLPCFVA